MARVALTTAQKRFRWAENLRRSIGGHVNRFDPEAEFHNMGELAEAAGLSRTGLSMILHGHQMPSIVNFARIVTACNIDAETIAHLIRQMGEIK